LGHPSEYFIKFTLAGAWGSEEEATNLAALNATLKEFGLLHLTEPQYNSIMADFQPPEGFRFNSSKHDATRKFMTSEKIHGLWNPNKNEKRVLLEVIDGHYMVRHDLNLLLMGNVPRDVVVQKINKKWNLNPPFNVEMIDTYAHYYWNVGNVSIEEWHELLSSKPYKDAFMAALYCGEQQALYRVGFNPKVDGIRALKEAHRQAFFRMEALRYEPDSKATTADLSKLSARTMKLHEMLFAEGSGLQEQLKQFRQVMMRRKDPNVKAIDQVIKDVGSYSGDGSKPDEGDQDDE
jgi:hypothetical protein